jgi:hypothetical protein
MKRGQGCCQLTYMFTHSWLLWSNKKLGPVCDMSSCFSHVIHMAVIRFLNIYCLWRKFTSLIRIHPASNPVVCNKLFPGGKGVGACSSSLTLTANLCQGQENVDVYVNSPIRLHGVVFSELSTRSTLPFTCATRSIPYLQQCCGSIPEGGCTTRCLSLYLRLLNWFFFM